MDQGSSILVVAAVTAELGPLVRRLGLKRTDRGPVIRYTGRHHGRPIVAAVTGIGRQRAAAAMAELLDEHRPGCVHVIGFAGGTNPRLRAGDVVIPGEVIDAATDRRYRPTAACDAAEGVLWTGDGVLGDAAGKKRLFDQRGVDAVDMETAALAELCERRGVAWLSVRAVSDAAEEPLPGFVSRLNRPDGRADAWAAIRAVLADPRRIGALVRLARRSRAAARALSDEVAGLL